MPTQEQTVNIGQGFEELSIDSLSRNSEKRVEWFTKARKKAEVEMKAQV